MHKYRYSINQMAISFQKFIAYMWRFEYEIYEFILKMCVCVCMWAAGGFFYFFHIVSYFIRGIQGKITQSTIT